jgi:Flp pilus assembly protein TadD
MARKDLSRALATVEEGLRWVKNDPSLYDDKGVILREMGRIQPAKAAFIRALELDPNYADAARHLQELSR